MKAQQSPYWQQSAQMTANVAALSHIVPLTYTAKQAGVLMGVSRDVIYDLVKTGKLKPLAGIRHHHFSHKEIMTFINGKRPVGVLVVG